MEYRTGEGETQALNKLSKTSPVDACCLLDYIDFRSSPVARACAFAHARNMLPDYVLDSLKGAKISCGAEKIDCSAFKMQSLRSTRHSRRNPQYHACTWSEGCSV